MKGLQLLKSRGLYEDTRKVMDSHLLEMLLFDVGLELKINAMIEFSNYSIIDLGQEDKWKFSHIKYFHFAQSDFYSTHIFAHLISFCNTDIIVEISNILKPGEVCEKFSWEYCDIANMYYAVPASSKYLKIESKKGV